MVVVPQNYWHDLALLDQAPQKAKTIPPFQERELSLYADPFIFTKSCWHTHLGGLGDWVIHSRGTSIGCSKEQPGKEGQPAVAATQGPKDELMAQSSHPSAGNPCARTLDSLESNVPACHSLLQLCSVCACLCMEIIHTRGVRTHNRWCFSSCA